MKDFNKIKINGCIYSKETILNNAKHLYKNVIEEDVWNFLANWFDSSKHMAVQSSGSTGEPKMLLIEKEKMVASAKMTCAFLNLKKDDTALLCISPKHIGGMMMIVRALVCKLNLIIGALNNNPLQLVEESIDFCAMVPYQVQCVLEESPSRLALIKQLIIGGGNISQSLEERLKPYSNTIYSTFGMTETISHIALRKVGKEDFYTCLPGITVSINEKECLQIKAHMLLNQLLLTNDLVEIINATQFRWLGRSDFAIESGGLKFIPEILERKLSPHISSRFFIASLPDEKLNNKIILVVEQKEKLPNDVFDSLTKFEKPKTVYYLNKFVETASGKINRLASLQLLS